MSFQSSIQIRQGFGVPGELFTDSPYIVQPYTIQSVSAANNIIGSTCCSITSQGFCQAGSGRKLQAQSTPACFSGPVCGD